MKLWRLNVSVSVSDLFLYYLIYFCSLSGLQPFTMKYPAMVVWEREGHRLEPFVTSQSSWNPRAGDSRKQVDGSGRIFTISTARNHADRVNFAFFWKGAASTRPSDSRGCRAAVAPATRCYREGSKEEEPREKRETKSKWNMFTLVTYTWERGSGRGAGLTSGAAHGMVVWTLTLKKKNWSADRKSGIDYLVSEVIEHRVQSWIE